MNRTQIIEGYLASQVAAHSLNAEQRAMLSRIFYSVNPKKDADFLTAISSLMAHCSSTLLQEIPFDKQASIIASRAMEILLEGE